MVDNIRVSALRYFNWGKVSMSREDEQQRGFQIKDKRLSSKSEEEKEKIFKEDQSPANTKIEPDKSTLDQQSAESAPEVNFSALIFSLGTQALMQLGEMEDPISKKKEQNIPQAKQSIDILEILQEKTKGNLTPEEESLLNNLLYDLRMRFVNLSK